MDEKNSLVQSSLLCVIIQMPEHDAIQFLTSAQFHPNDVVRAMGVLLVTVRDDAKTANSSIKHVFHREPSSVMYDNVALLYAMTHSHELAILNQLRAVLLQRSDKAGQGDLSEIFDDLLRRIDRKLAPQFRLQPTDRVIRKSSPQSRAGNSVHAEAQAEREAEAARGALG